MIKGVLIVSFTIFTFTYGSLFSLVRVKYKITKIIMKIKVRELFEVKKNKEILKIY